MLSLKSIKFLEIISNYIFLEQKSACSFKIYLVVIRAKTAPTSSFVLALHFPVKSGGDFMSRMPVPPPMIPKVCEMSHGVLGGPVIPHALSLTGTPKELWCSRAPALIAHFPGLLTVI